MNIYIDDKYAISRLLILILDWLTFETTSSDALWPNPTNLDPALLVINHQHLKLIEIHFWLCLPIYHDFVYFSYVIGLDHHLRFYWHFQHHRIQWTSISDGLPHLKQIIHIQSIVVICFPQLFVDALVGLLYLFL